MFIKKLQLWAQDLTERAYELDHSAPQGHPITPVCCHPLSFWLCGLNYPNRSQVPFSTVYNRDGTKPWLFRDCMGHNVDLGTKGWSGEKDRKVVLSTLDKEETKWVCLCGQGTYPSPGSQLKTWMWADSMLFLHGVWFHLQGDLGRGSKKCYKRLYYDPTSGWHSVPCAGCIPSWFSLRRSWDYKRKDHLHCISWDDSQRVDTTLLIQCRWLGETGWTMTI